MQFGYYSAAPPDGANGMLVAEIGYLPGSSMAQSAAFQTGFYWKYNGAAITFTGPNGALFDGNDLSTLHVTTGSPLSVQADFDNASEEISVDILVEKLTIQPSLTVPEPEAATLLVIGLYALMHRRRVTH